MTRCGAQFWVGLPVGLLGVAVGISNIARGAGDGGVRNLALGFVCLALASGWVIYVLTHLRHSGRME